MAAPDFDKLDLNLLRAFLKIYDAGSTVQAAKALNLSQPAVSRTLQRLRDHFSDPLFVRSQRGLVPTAFAEQLAHQLPEALDHLAKACRSEQDFTPQTLEQHVSIALTPVSFHAFGVELYLLLKQQAPGLSVDLLNWEHETREQLMLGNIDIGMHYAFEDTSKLLFQYPLRQAIPCMMVRKGHPLAQLEAELSLEQVLEYSHCGCLIAEFNELRSLCERYAAEHQLELKVETHWGDLPTLVELVTRTDLILGGPIGYLAGFPDKLTKLNVRIPQAAQAMDVAIYYHQRNRNSALHVWLRDQIAELAKEYLAIELEVAL